MLRPESGATEVSASASGDLRENEQSRVASFPAFFLTSD